MKAKPSLVSTRAVSKRKTALNDREFNQLHSLLMRCYDLDPKDYQLAERIISSIVSAPVPGRVAKGGDR